MNTCTAVLAVVSENGVVADLHSLFEVDRVFENDLELLNNRFLRRKS
jgi:hypothetical protein